MKILIVGAGLYGCTAAKLLKDRGHEVEIAEASSQIGGMCHTHFSRGIEVHDFGPHIFHTDDEWVWNFVNSICAFNRYEHHVLAKHDNDLYFMPFNLHMMQQFFSKKLGKQMDLESIRLEIFNEKREAGIEDPKNLEEQAVSLVGKSLYEAFIKHYTEKQWHKDPAELSPDIIKRLPVRYDFNVSYYNDRYVGIPECGYTAMVEALVPDIRIRFNEKLSLQDIKTAFRWFDKVIYTGPLDELFECKHGQLEWRSLNFTEEEFFTESVQGAACVNYVDDDVPWTRTHEYKWYHPENREQISQEFTVLQTETPQDWDISKPRFYPVSSRDSLEMHKRYMEEAAAVDGLVIGGRLGKFKYLDMDDTILAARDDVEKIIGKVIF